MVSTTAQPHLFSRTHRGEERLYHLQITFELIAADAVSGPGNMRDAQSRQMLSQEKGGMLRHQRALF